MIDLNSFYFLSEQSQSPEVPAQSQQNKKTQISSKVSNPNQNKRDLTTQVEHVCFHALKVTQLYFEVGYFVNSEKTRAEFFLWIISLILKNRAHIFLIKWLQHTSIKFWTIYFLYQTWDLENNWKIYILILLQMGVKHRNRIIYIYIYTHTLTYIYYSSLLVFDCSVSFLYHCVNKLLSEASSFWAIMCSSSRHADPCEKTPAPPHPPRGACC